MYLAALAVEASNSPAGVLRSGAAEGNSCHGAPGAESTLMP